MSADDAIFVQKREDDGLWVGQWGSMSADDPPDPKRAMAEEVFDSLENLVINLAEASQETEYGFRFPNLNNFGFRAVKEEPHGVQRYVKRPEQFEAQQFLGGAANGQEIVNWVTSNDGAALWRGALGPIVVDGEGTVFEGRPEGLRVLTATDGPKTARIGDYVLREGTTFTVVSEAIFEQRYEPRGS